MAVSVLWYLVVIVAALIVGALFCFLIGAIFMGLGNRRLKNKIPLKADGSYDKEKMMAPDAPNIDEKEVKEIEQREFAKFREFEKLRNYRIPGTEDKRTRRFAEQTARGKYYLEGIEELPREGNLGNRDDANNADFDRVPRETSRTDGKNNQRNANTGRPVI